MAFLNDSWICPKHVATKGVSDVGCFFLYHQELNRSSAYLSHFEFLLSFFIWSISVPANLVAVINFQRKHINLEFTFLISLHATLNITITVSQN